MFDKTRFHTKMSRIFLSIILSFLVFYMLVLFTACNSCVGVVNNCSQNQSTPASTPASVP